MTPEELFAKQNKILELEQELYESISQAVYDYNQCFYFTYRIDKTSVQTDFTFDFFLPAIESEHERKKITVIEFKSTGYKTSNNGWSDAVEFKNVNGDINNVYAFFMMNSKDFYINKDLLEKPSELKTTHLQKKDTNSVTYQKYDAVSLIDFLKDVHARIVFPMLKKESQEWPEILSDYKKIFNQLIRYLGTHKTSGLTPAQTDGLLHLQSQYDSRKLHNDLKKSLTPKPSQSKIKI